MELLNELKQAIEGIPLELMSAEIDLGEVVLRDGPESARLTAIWAIQKFFWDHPTAKNPGSTKRSLNEVLRQAKYMATSYLANEWPGLGERALLCLLNDAAKTGWHTGQYFNYQNIAEMLSSTLDEQETTTGISTWSFIVNELLPAAERMGIDPILLYGASSQIKKLRSLVPTARVILNSDMTDNMKQQYLEHFIGGAADATVRPDEYNKETTEFRGKKSRTVNKLTAYQVILPNEETWIIVRCPSVKDERVIETQLGSKVDLKVTDWRALTIMLVRMLKDFASIGEEPPELIRKLIKLTEKGRNNGGNKQASQGVEIERFDTDDP